MGSILDVKSTGLGKLRSSVRRNVTRRKKPVISINLDKKYKTYKRKQAHKVKCKIKKNTTEKKREISKVHSGKEYTIKKVHKPETKGKRYHWNADHSRIIYY